MVIEILTKPSFGKGEINKSLTIRYEEIIGKVLLSHHFIFGTLQLTFANYECNKEDRDYLNEPRITGIN